MIGDKFMNRFAVACICVAFALSVAPQKSFAQKAVLTEDFAYLLSPVELIAGPTVISKSISPDGKSVLLVRSISHLGLENLPSVATPQPLRPTESKEVICWDARSHRSTVVWKSTLPQTEIELIGTMAKTDSFYFIVNETTLPDPKAPQDPPISTHKLMRVTSRMSRSQEVIVPESDLYIGVELSPSQPFGVITLQQSNTDSGKNAVHNYLFDASGRFENRIPTPPERFGGVRWSEDGNLVIRLRNPIPPVEFYSVDSRTNALTLLASPPKPYNPSPSPAKKLPILVVEKRLSLEDIGLKREAASVLYLESYFKSKQSKALIASDGTEPTLVASGGGVFYLSQGAEWFQPLLKMNLADYLVMKKKADRLRAISNARQLGTGVLMYTQDYDEMLPTPDGINDKISPYLKNDSLFDGFNYIYPGGSLADISNPSTTTLGYVDGEGGRAVIYGDGHVKWEDN